MYVPSVAGGGMDAPLGKVRPLGECKELARQACENVQLCAGLEAGIEGNLHAVRAVWPESSGWQYDEGTEANPVAATFREMCTDAGCARTRGISRWG